MEMSDRAPSPMRLQRLRRGLPLIDVAQEIGVVPSRLSYAERGYVRLTDVQERRRRELLGIRSKGLGLSKRAEASMLNSTGRNEHARPYR